MVTTIDHISGGRAVLGIGAAWMELEHRAFGFEFGDRPGHAPALARRGAADHPRHARRHDAERAGGRPLCDAVGAQRPAPDPAPRARSSIGGSGRKVTLKLVAQYADMNNLGNPIEGLLDAEAAMVEHCEAVGRDERTIERTVEIQRVVIRDSADAAWAREREILAHNGGAQLDEVRPGSTEVDSDRAVVGTPDEVFAQLRPYVDAGYHHLICGFPPPYDEESMRPARDRGAAAARGARRRLKRA